ncbi:MAG: c-type cytochrome [Acidobacteria bacterium]|nr:c-type cytochrome [Acidobacteriota bacterium]
MAEKKGVGHAFNIDFLNVVFAASSVFLFLSVIWMVWDDYDRDWKNTQRRFAELEYQVTEASRAQAERSVDANKLAELKAQKAAAEKNVADNRQKVEELENRLQDIENRLYRDMQQYQFAKATFDVDRYAFEAARAAGDPDAATRGEAVAALEKRVAELNLQVEKTTAERNAVQQELAKFTGEVTAIQKRIDEMNLEQTRLSNQLRVLEPSMLKDYFRDAPLLDFMAPTLKVRQVMLPNVVDDVNFVKVAKMDRCQTCHLAIDRVGYEKYPQPFTTHPNLAAYVGSASPHPVEQVGCTVCHEGMGQSVSFRDAAHMPSTEEQKQEWEETYHWEEPHLWDYPMLPTNLTEASCAKCHKSEVFVPGAERLNVAYETYERAGCYACHKTRGFENLRKPGPILTKIDSKLSPDWVKTWIRNPRAVKPSTWMPRVWYNSNSSAPADAVRNEVEINATVAYLFANTAPHQFPVASPPRGDAGAGEQVVKSIGCLGCHVIDEKSRGEVSPRRTFGQPLQNIGNKTTYEWLFNWVRDPTHYNAATYMPDLRLTDQQVADVATYLSGLKQEGGDQPKATPDEAAVDAVLLDYFKNVMPFEEAQASLGKLDAQAKQVELGRRVISRYGCFSCHDIKGFENTQPIGTELSEAGSKLVSRLDFAFVTEIPHSSKTAWYRTKLHDPRIFDRGRELPPLDKLRMPNFDFSDEENDRLLTALMSFQREIQPAQAMPVKSARRDFLTQGRALVHRRNCVGCHIIEGSGGDYTKLVADPSLGPPLLTPEGARVQHDWLYAFIRGPITIRPWLDVRMPAFNLGDPIVNGIISYFGAVSNKIGPFQAHEVVTTAKVNAAGKELFDLLRCQQCHVLGEIPKDQPTANLAPDLRMAPDRLQADWILDWLIKPSDIVPGTRMPAFWAEYPKSPYPQLNGDAEAQIRAIRDYLMTLRGGPSPRVDTNTRVANNH